MQYMYPCIVIVILYHPLYQGFKGDEALGDIVRAAMFSKSFPDVKSPQEMAFEGKVEEVITGEEIDLDTLSAADFLTEDEDEHDTTSMLEIVNNLDFLGTETKKRKAEEENVQNKKKIKTEQDPSNMDKEDNEKKNEILKEVEEMDEVDRKAVGTFFLSLKEMRKVAKLNLRVLTRLEELGKRYPALAFIYKVMKPISEIMPQNPINTLIPILQIAGLKAVTGGQKYETENVLKIIPKRVIVDGHIKHRCSVCEFERASWGAVNTHILKDHVGQSYVCQYCNKILTSMDGLRHHVKNKHPQ